MSDAGRNMVIFGGSSGIGLATARAALADGWQVTIIGRTQEKLKAAAKALSAGERLAIAAMDTRDEPAVASFFGGIAQDSLDAVVVTASNVAHGPFAEARTDDIRAMFDSKFLAPYVIAREALPRLKKGGSITFFSGVLSRRPGTNGAGLAAVNAAVEGLTRALARELGPDVRVNAVSPGMTRTDAYAHLPEERRDAMFAGAAERLPVKRVATADEIAQGVMLLATNGFMTGHVLDVDGGHMIA